MKIVFVSNFMNHHQLPISLELSKMNEFYFVSTMPIAFEQSKLGYEDLNSKYSFIIRTYENENNYNIAMNLCNDADVVIIGSASDGFIKQRLKQNKMTFKYAERSYKTGITKRFELRKIVGEFIHHTVYRNRPLYMLCASAYTSYDHNLWGNYKNKSFKWGYFPEIKEHEIEMLMANKKNNKKQLLWTGRFLDWKHPEKALMVAKRLKEDGLDFNLNMIGIGLELQKSLEFIENNNLTAEVKLLGSMSPHKVREYMEKANIFLFTSDFNEGWGAVLNESMNSGCAVVASHAIGSVPYLLKNNENGIIYKNDNFEELYQKVKSLVEDSQNCDRLGRDAYFTMKNEWNAKNASKKLLFLIESLQNKDISNLPKDGVCSKAEIIRENWFK